MSGYPDFAPGAVVVSTVTMNDGPELTIHEGFVAEVTSQDGPWLALLNVQDQWPAGHFRIATPEEAEAFRLLPAARAGLKDVSSPQRPHVLYGIPLHIGVELSAQPDLDPQPSEVANLTAWLHDERRLVLDLRRQLAAAQDEITELRGALAKVLA